VRTVKLQIYEWQRAAGTDGEAFSENASASGAFAPYKFPAPSLRISHIALQLSQTQTYQISNFFISLK
jgi:hypothetical protein